MEIINIEAQTFEAMMNRFEAFTQKVENLCEDHQDKSLLCWLDNQDVCRILNISSVPFKPTGITVHWLIPRSIIKYATNRKV